MELAARISFSEAPRRMLHIADTFHSTMASIFAERVAELKLNADNEGEVNIMQRLRESYYLREALANEVLSSRERSLR